jgi:hypothetical protein
VVTLGNPADDPFASALLQATIDAAAASGYVVKILNSRPDPRQKGSILIDVLIGVSSNAVWDLLMASARRIRVRPDYNPDIKVRVDDQEVTVDFIQRRG